MQTSFLTSKSNWVESCWVLAISVTWCLDTIQIKLHKPKKQTSRYQIQEDIPMTDMFSLLGTTSRMGFQVIKQNSVSNSMLHILLFTDLVG